MEALKGGGEFGQCLYSESLCLPKGKMSLKAEASAFWSFSGEFLPAAVAVYKVTCFPPLPAHSSANWKTHSLIVLLPQLLEWQESLGSATQHSAQTLAAQSCLVEVGSSWVCALQCLAEGVAHGLTRRPGPGILLTTLSEIFSLQPNFCLLKATGCPHLIFLSAALL